MTNWLNSSFALFDYAILNLFHLLADSAGTFLTPLAKVFAFVGDNGYLSLLIAFIMLCFSKTRKCGVCIVFAIGFGALFTNLIIKDIVARPRPYASEIQAFTDWWNRVGAPLESEFSFPSGHTTAAMASMTALCIAIGKKRKWLIAPSALYVVLMGASRNYLMVHYPSDVIGGIIIGGIAATLACTIVFAIWKKLEKNAEKKFWHFVLFFDVISVIRLFKKRNKSTQTEK